MMNGAGFGSSYPETFQQQHRIRSMSWCEGGELMTGTANKLKSDNAHLNQNEFMSSSSSLIRSDSIELQSCNTEIINLKKPSARKNAWGCLSYADLIAKAIESSPNQRLTLNQIYSWMVENVPYFRAKGQTNSSAGWKNSIRHNLSLHGRFVRVQNEGAGKSSWWMVQNNNRMQKTPRRRSTTMDSKSFDKKKKANTMTKDCFSPLESSSLSASVPAYLGSCSQYQQQPHQPYHQFPCHQQQSQTQPLDSFETAFRPVDRQHCSVFSEKDTIFSTKNSSMLRYGDNCFNVNNVISENIFENNRIGNSRSPNDDQLFCSLRSSTPSLVKQTDTCQQFGEVNYNMTTALLSRPLCTDLPDFFKLPDEAWRQYLPPSPNGLTETVISSESLTALLETAAESEIIDLVPPTLSTFDEGGQDSKKMKDGKEQCIFTTEAIDKMPDLSNTCRADSSKESTSKITQHKPRTSAFSQDKELVDGSTPRFVLPATSVAFKSPSSTADLSHSSFRCESLGSLSSNDHLTLSDTGEFGETFKVKYEPYTQPYKMPLYSELTGTTAMNPAVPSLARNSDNENKMSLNASSTSQETNTLESAILNPPESGAILLPTSNLVAFSDV